MADTKLTDLPAIASPDDDDLVYVVSDPSGTPTSQKATVSALRGSILHQAIVTLTDAQIKVLPTTGVEVVAAQAGEVLVPISGVFHLHWVADYTNIDAASQIRISTGGTSSLASLDESYAGVTGLLAGGGPDTFGFTLPFANVVSPLIIGWAGAYTSDVVNRSVSISASNSGDFTGGDPLNSLTVSVAYLVLNTSTGAFV